MNFKKFFIILLSVLLFKLFFKYVIEPSKEDHLKANVIIQDITSKDTDKLSIVIHSREGYSYLIITDKTIIKEFITALHNDTWIVAAPAGHHSYRFLITLHHKNNSDLIELESDSTDINSNYVDITLFDVKNIDIYDMYYISTTKREEFSSLFSGMYGHGKYSLRNELLHDVLNKHIKGKGIKYNPYLKKWSKN